MINQDFAREIMVLRPQLVSYAYTLTKCKEASQDLFQEMSFKALKYAHKFKTGTNLKAWLFTILRNTFINNYRRSKKHSVLVNSDDNIGLMDLSVEKVQNTAEGQMRVEELTALVRSLRPELMQPFLKIVSGYSYQEVADELQIPIGTVKSRVHVARKKLQKAVLTRDSLSAVSA